MGWFDDHRDSLPGTGLQDRSVEHDPPSGAREHARERDLAGDLRGGRAEGLPGDGQDGGWHPVGRCSVAAGQLVQPALHAGSEGLGLEGFGEDHQAWCFGCSGSVASPTSRPRRAPSARCGASASSSSRSSGENSG